MRRALAACAAVLAAAALAAAPASADTFGSNDMTQPLDAGAHCASYPCTVVDLTHADGSDETGAPFDGILTAVRLRYAGDGAAATFRVLRASGAGHWTNVGPELPAALPDTGGVAATLTFPVRRPIAAGDALAVAGDSSIANDSYLASSALRACARRTGLHPVGTSQSYSTSGCDDEALLQGVVEPDEDGDGYGDQSQDGCPADPAIHDGPCSADVELTESVSPGRIGVYDHAVYTFTVRNLGTSPAQGAALRVPVGDTAELVSASPSTGRCGGVRAVFCWLGDLPAGATATVTIVVRPDNPGRLTLRSTVLSQTNDPIATNNTASASTQVTDPFAGVLLPQSKVSVRGRIARVLQACPGNSLRFCEGRATLTRSAPTVAGGPGGATVPRFSGPRLGRGSFRMQPGAVSTVSVKLSKKAARKLAKRHRLSAVVTALAQNGAGTTRTTYAPVKLVLKRRR